MLIVTKKTDTVLAFECRNCLPPSPHQTTLRRGVPPLAITCPRCGWREKAADMLRWHRTAEIVQQAASRRP